MQIETTRFGALTIDENHIITFPEGLPGFEGCRQFTLIPHGLPSGDKSSPFLWLQSLEDGGLAFLTMEPNQMFPDYAPQVAAGDLRALSLDQAGQRPQFYTLLTVPQGNPCGITANLLAPVVINPRMRLGRQTIINGDQYSLRHRLIPEEAI